MIDYQEEAIKCLQKMVVMGVQEGTEVVINDRNAPAPRKLVAQNMRREAGSFAESYEFRARDVQALEEILQEATEGGVKIVLENDPEYPLEEAERECLRIAVEMILKESPFTHFYRSAVSSGIQTGALQISAVEQHEAFKEVAQEFFLECMVNLGVIKIGGREKEENGHRKKT